MVKVSKIKSKALKRFKERENAYREYIHKPIFTGNGILDQIDQIKKPAEPIKVEDLYEACPPIYWDILDKLLKDRVDLHDRIKRYKESRVA